MPDSAGTLRARTAFWEAIIVNIPQSINQIHGLGGTPEYRSYAGMMRRCYSPTFSGYEQYGGRGIRVCDKWRGSFLAFLADMGLRPSPRHSLDRIDGSLGYSPENCRWATPDEQVRNRDVTRWYAHDGETMCMADWATRVGMSAVTLKKRLDRGWSFERAISEPLKPQNNKAFIGRD